MGGYAGSCPSFLRVLPIAGMGGYTGSCPSFLRVLPITGMGGCPGRCPFGLRVLPITHGRTPFSSQGPSNNRHGRTPGKMPCVSPGPSSNYYGTLAFFFPFVSQVVLLVLRSFLADITHIAFDVKCSTTTSTDPRNKICKLQRSILTFSTKY